MNRAPTECELGANGDKKKYKLELQLIAHFGLVNYLFLNDHCLISMILAGISKCW
jgi:GTPase involved in cell partitioning and DNA repair